MAGLETERTERLGALNWYGYSQYVQEVEKSKIITTEKAEVYIREAVQMTDDNGSIINYLI